MFSKKIEDKKYTPVYSSQAHSSSNVKVPTNTTFSRDFRSTSVSKVTTSSGSKVATNNSLLKNSFLNSGSKSSTNVPLKFKATGVTGIKPAQKTSISKNLFLNSDDKYKPYGNTSSSTSVNRTNFVTTTHTSERSFLDRRSEMTTSSVFSPTFGPTGGFNSKYDDSKYDFSRPSSSYNIKTPMKTTSVATTSTTPIVITSILNKKPIQTATPSISVRPQMKHLPFKLWPKP